MKRILSSFIFISTNIIALSCNEVEPSHPHAVDEDETSVETDEQPFMLLNAAQIKQVAQTISTKQQSITGKARALGGECASLNAILPEYNESVLAGNKTLRNLYAAKIRAEKNNGRVQGAIKSRRTEIAQLQGLNDAYQRLLQALTTKNPTAQISKDMADLNQKVKNDNTTISALMTRESQTDDPTAVEPIQAQMDDAADQLTVDVTTKDTVEDMGKDPQAIVVATIKAEIGKNKVKIDALKAEVVALLKANVPNLDQLKAVNKAIEAIRKSGAPMPQGLNLSCKRFFGL